MLSSRIRWQIFGSADRRQKNSAYVIQHVTCDHGLFAWEGCPSFSRQRYWKRSKSDVAPKEYHIDTLSDFPLSNQLSGTDVDGTFFNVILAKQHCLRILDERRNFDPSHLLCFVLDNWRLRRLVLLFLNTKLAYPESPYASVTSRSRH